MPAVSDLTRVVVFAAIIAVLGLPGGVPLFGSVPITAQTLGVMLAGAVLGRWLGPAAVALFLALVALGLPLLAGGRGGIAVFFGPSVGYLIGWILGAFVIGLIVDSTDRRQWWRTAIALVLGGIVAIYLIGVPLQSFITRLPLGETLVQSALFIPGDLVKVVLATIIVTTLARAYPRAFRRAVADQKAPAFAE